MNAKVPLRIGRAAPRVLLAAVLVAAMTLGTGLGAASASWQAGLPTEIVSVASDGTQANGDCYDASTSRDGGHTAFESPSDNLVPGDTNGYWDVFFHDQEAGTTVRVSVDSDGDQATNGDSYNPATAGDAGSVAFDSSASDLVPGDTEGERDIFVHMLGSGETTRVSTAYDGSGGGENDSYDPEITHDGGLVVFESRADNLVPNDNNNDRDIFVRDMASGETTRVSIASDGTEADSDSYDPDISSDGRWVVFESNATNLVADDNNSEKDVYIHDMQTGETRIVSVLKDGTQGNDGSEDARVSTTGPRVAFESDASNFFSGDANNEEDVFVKDMQTGELMHVSVASDGTPGDEENDDPDISNDGSIVAFESESKNLVADQLTRDGDDDVFVHEIDTGFTLLESRAQGGEPGNDDSDEPSVSGDSSFVAFESDATNLIGEGNDTSAHGDIFLRRRTWVFEDGALRHAGATRYDTAIAVSESTFPRGAGTVVIATGDNWPDALCGSALAGTVGGPVLLTPSAALPQTVKDEIDRLGAENAYILGGTGVVSSAVETELESMLDGWVNRLSGMNRYMTSERIANHVVLLKGGDWDGTTLVTTGENFADAIAGAPLAAGFDWPVLLANPVSGDVETPEGATGAVILGGTGAVPPAVETDLKSGLLSNDDVIRLGGATRYDTAAMVAQYGVDMGLGWNGVGIATGENFPDGLTGGSALGMQRSVLLLTPTASLAPAAASKLTDNKADITTTQILGGPGAVSPAVESQVKSTLGM